MISYAISINNMYDEDITEAVQTNIVASATGLSWYEVRRC